jgi:putative exporter of polyketide antibiotics
MTEGLAVRLFDSNWQKIILSAVAVLLGGLLFSRPEYKQTSEEERRKEIEPEA